MDTFTEILAAPWQAVAANNLGHQGLSATPETPETEQQHILDDVMTSGSEKLLVRREENEEFQNA